MRAADLPVLDQHSIEVDASPDLVWHAAADVVRRRLAGPPARTAARVLGCVPGAGAQGTADWPAVGAAVPGFQVAASDAPEVLELVGRHRFSRYAIVLRVDPTPTGARCVLESRAAFPGRQGTAYRLAVVGSRGHVLAVRRLLADIRRSAEA